MTPPVGTCLSPCVRDRAQVARPDHGLRGCGCDHEARVPALENRPCKRPGAQRVRQECETGGP